MTFIASANTAVFPGILVALIKISPIQKIADNSETWFPGRMSSAALWQVHDTARPGVGVSR
jgi:hypothetical protein